MTRVVLDRNVLIGAAVRPDGTCAQLVDRARAGEVEMLLSPRLMDDVTSSLIDRLSPGEAGRFVWRLRGAGTLVNDPHPSWPWGDLDPGSAHVVALARERGAAVVVTGHKGLQRTGAPGLRVTSPGVLLDQLAATRITAAALERARASRQGEVTGPVIERGLGIGR